MKLAENPHKEKLAEWEERPRMSEALAEGKE